MADRSKLECDVHDLLDEANVLMLMPALALNQGYRAQALDLLSRMYSCADEAHAGGVYDAEKRLRDAADMLRSRLCPDSE